MNDLNVLLCCFREKISAAAMAINRELPRVFVLPTPIQVEQRCLSFWSVSLGIWDFKLRFWEWRVSN